ncbi:protein Skeletor, isoforms B/C-like [Dysidea avara]|uniref:protein Skeletor, isoforms B/C-like n=1 Tax=Dysidea avara TaxID=196820 RepID=UPI0033253A9A
MSIVGMRFVALLAVVFALSEGREFLGRLTERQHEVRGNVYAISCSELVIENFYYDGFGPAVYAFVGKNPSNGPDRNSGGVDATVTFGSQTFVRFPRSRHTNTVIQIKLPDSYNINEANWLSIWCRSFSANFGHITFGNIRQQTQKICARKPVHCQNLRDGYDVCWSINNTTGTPASAEITLCSNNRLDNYFMGFGISKSPTVTSMFNADPTLCWRDGDGKWTVQDYYISAYAQCGASQGTVLGVCMDTRYNGGVDNLAMTSGGELDGVFWCTYTRPLQSSNPDHDNNITLTGPQAVVWAMGPVNQGVILRHPVGFRAIPNVLVDFGDGTGADECDKLSTQECCKDRYRITGPPPLPTTPPPPCKPCRNRRNKVGRRRRFVFTIGSSEGRCGYEALANSTGGWGIAWYVDGCLIPHLRVRRGRKYTFCVQGGNNSADPSNYHPLYITSSPVGGYFQNRNMNETVYAGIDENDNALFTGPLVYHDDDDVKRCCTRKKTVCPDGATMYTWRPTRDTPDLVYYQCATHFFLGWKISVRN